MLDPCFEAASLGSLKLKHCAHTTWSMSMCCYDYYYLHVHRQAKLVQVLGNRYNCWWLSAQFSVHVEL